jgi:peptidyl-tRNA hydrolase
MTEHDSAEAVENRSNQEDPITMYLIVRESLGMSIGKTAAQCGHAVGMLYRKYDKQIAVIDGHIDPVYGPPDDLLERIPERVKNALEIWDEWDRSLFRKVTLTSDDKEWEKVKALDYPKVIVVDAGLTEIAPGSETIIGLWPMFKSKVPKVIKKLQVLK